MKKLTSQSFITKARQVHGDRYSYDFIVYRNNKTKVKIICPEHGPFEQTPNGHLIGNGCPDCGRTSAINNRCLSIDDFIAKARQVHGNKYDYSAVEYINTKTKVTIICPEHGPFEQTTGHHMNGIGCPDCGVIKRSKSNTYNTDDFITKARHVHGDRYDYSLVSYDGCRKDVKIVCNIHGIFEQAPYIHLRGSGCGYCGNNIKLNIDNFITKAKEVHGDRYDYSLVDYKSAHTKVTIICPDHGPFEQTPNNHVDKKNSCPLCISKISNQEMEFVKNIREIYNGEIITNTRSVITPYELDVYLPDKKMAFEYNGMYWHREGVNKPIGYHQMKIDMCKGKGIDLYHIWEDDWIKNKQKVVGLLHKRLDYK
jgi:hypothetical protein